MKRGILLAVCMIVSLVVALPFASCAKPAATPAPSVTPAPASASKAGKIVLKWNHVWPENHTQTRYFFSLIASINERCKSQGVEIEFYPAEGLGKSAEMLEAIGKGVYDAGSSSISYYTGSVPEGAITDVHMVTDITDCVKLAQEALPILTEAFEQKLNVKLLETQLNPGDIYIASLKRPVAKMEDFRGLKIRSQGGAVSVKLNELGVSPVTMATAEVYTALQRGTVDGACWSPGSFVSYKIWEIAKYVLCPSLITTASACWISLDKFNRLPSNVQKVIQDVCTEVQERNHYWLYYEGENQVRYCAEKGMELSVQPPEEVSKCVAKMAPAVDKWFLDQGGTRGQRILDLAKKYRR